MFSKERESNKISKQEIEDKISRVGDYVKMDFLQSCLKKHLDFETRRFVLLKLADVYEDRGMFSEAARLISTSAEINSTLDGKSRDYVRSMQLFVKSGKFDEADISFSKALACGEGLQKERVKTARKEVYQKQCKEFLKKDKRRLALEAHERFLPMNLSPNEKEETQKVLLDLYEKLGKMRDYFNLKKNIEI